MKISLAAIILILPIFCIAQYPTIYNGKARLHGKVKKVSYSVRISLDTTELREMPLDTSLYSVDSFDKNGYGILSYKIKDGTVSEISKYTYEFNANGNLIMRLDIDNPFQLIVSTTFIYDSLGNVIEEINQQRCEGCDSSKSSIKYTYVSGLLATKESPVVKTIYKYNDNRQITEETDYFTKHPEWQPVTKKYSYNSGGDKVIMINDSGITKICRYDEYDNIVNKNGLATEYLYDSHGNWLLRIEQLQKQAPIIEDVEPAQYYRLTVRKIEYY